MGTITKKKLINTIAQNSGLQPHEVRTVVQGLLDCLVQYLVDGDRIELRDFGVFEVVKRKKKIGRNPKNASVPIVIPERNAVKFVPGKNMKRLVSKEDNQESQKEEKPPSFE